MPYDSHPAVGVGETQVASGPRTTLWYEIVVVAVFSVVLVAMAPTLLNAIPNDMLRMLAKGPFYVVFVAVPFLIQRILHMPRIDLGFDKEDIPRQILNGVGIFVAIAVVITSASFALGDNKHMLLGQGGGIDFFRVFHLVVFVGFGEEMLFRGYFLGRLKLVTQSKAWAIALSAGLFGLWHFPVGQDILQVIVTGILGAVYAFMMFRLKGCTTLSVALAHGLHDIFLLVLGTALS